jgi:hypothetical protein
LVYTLFEFLYISSQANKNNNVHKKKKKKGMTTTEYSRSLSYEMDKKEESVLFLGKKYKLNNILFIFSSTPFF